MDSNISSPNLKGQVAVVTGGGRGIGRAIARGLAAAGAAVAVAARSADEVAETAALIRAGGGQALELTVDVTDAAAVNQMAQQAERALGPVDILINNAGMFGPIGPAWDADAEAWWRTIEVNLKGTFLCSQALLPSMIQRGRGYIINVSSSVALRPTPYSTAYATSKAALAHLSGCIALETQGHGVAVFAIHPGTVLTEMTQGIIGSEAGATWLPRTRKTFEEGRSFPPERAAEMVVYLVSGAADALAGRLLLATDDLPELARQARAGS